MAVLYIMCGYPFSGKSTIARKISLEENATIISIDDYLDNEITLPEEEWTRVYSTAFEHTQKLLGENKSVIFDATNYSKNIRNKLRSLASLTGASSKVIFVPITREQAYERLLLNRKKHTRKDVGDEDFREVIDNFDIPTYDENTAAHFNNLNLSPNIKSNLIIRAASLNESEKLANIYKQDNLTEEVAKVARSAEVEFGELGTKRLIWFAEIEAVVVGSIQLVLVSHQTDMANGKTIAMIHHLRVAQKYQSSGVGSLLHETLEREALRRGFHKLTLEVEKTNNRAINIYGHWGYKYVREGHDPQEIVMIKEL